MLASTTQGLRGTPARMALLAPFVLVGFPALGYDARSHASVELTPCHLDGLRDEVRCGTIEVPRDPDVPDAGTIEITFAVVPALATRHSADPLVVFPGGPGQPASGYGRLVATAFDEVRETRDLVLIDPRGTSGAAMLRCDADGMLTSAAAEGVRALRDCARELGIEPRWYSSRLVAADAEALRATLGYELVNLWGGSYGTRFALEYASRYGDRVRAVVLDGAIAPGVSILISAARHAERAFALLVESCERDAACGREFPDPRGDRDTVIGGSETTRQVVRDPATGVERPIELDRDGRIGLVRGAPYTPRHAALLPLALRRGAQGDFGPLLALGAAAGSWSIDTMAIGATLAVLCADEASDSLRERAKVETVGTFVGDSYARFWLDACEGMPTSGAGLLAGNDARALPLAMPALVLSGERDPVTPPSAGDEAARAFTRATHVVVPGAGHNVSHLRCVPELIRTFLDAADPDAVDGSCAGSSPAPPFALGTTGFLP